MALRCAKWVLSVNILAGSMVLSPVGACPPHDGVGSIWWINAAGSRRTGTVARQRRRGDRISAPGKAGAIAVAADIGPIAPQPLAFFPVGVMVRQLFAGRTAIDVLVAEVDTGYGFIRRDRLVGSNLEMRR